MFRYRLYKHSLNIMQLNCDFLYSLIRFHSLLNLQIVHELKYVAILLAVAPQFLVISVLAKSQMPAKKCQLPPQHQYTMASDSQSNFLDDACVTEMLLTGNCVLWFRVSITCWYRSLAATQRSLLQLFSLSQFRESMIFKIVACLCVVVSLGTTHPTDTLSFKSRLRLFFFYNMGATRG